MHVPATQQRSGHKSNSVLWCLPLDCFPSLSSKPALRHKQSRTGNQTAAAAHVAQHIEDFREGTACHDPLIVSHSRSVIEDCPQMPKELSPALQDEELSAVGESIQEFLTHVEKNEGAFEKLLEEVRELNDLVQLHREQLRPDVQDVQMSLTGETNPYVADLEAANNGSEQTAAENFALRFENSEDKRSKAVVSRLVCRILEKRQQVELSIAIQDVGDNTVLRARTKDNNDSEPAQALSLGTTLENVASERREDIPTRSIQDRTEWAKMRSLRRSGTAYENEPGESRADENVASERRENVVSIRGTQDRAEWAKMRALRRSGTAYENEPAESQIDVNAASEGRKDVPIRSTQDRTEWATKRALRRSDTAYANEPAESRADVNVGSERREDVPIRSTYDRTEWAKLRSVHRSEHAYENEPAESRADVSGERRIHGFAACGA